MSGTSQELHRGAAVAGGRVEGSQLLPPAGFLLSLWVSGGEGGSKLLLRALDFPLAGSWAQ